MSDPFNTPVAPAPAGRITLGDNRPAALPVVKRTRIGETFHGAIITAVARDQQRRLEDGSYVTVYKSDGKARQEMVITCMVLPGTTALAGIGDDESVPKPGTLVRLIIKGKMFADWIDAKRELPDGQIAVGDVVSTATTHAVAYDGPGKGGPDLTEQAQVDAARQRGKTIGVYGPLVVRVPDPTSEWTAKAIAKYQEMSTPARDDRPVVAAQEDDPFNR